jgi:Phage integrase SAM-like domain
VNVRVIEHKRGNGKWAIDFYCPITKRRKYENFDTKKEAVDRKRELEGKEAKGEYRPLHRRTWAEFIAEYQEKILNHGAPKTRRAYGEAIIHFERLCAPQEMRTITTRTIDEFSAKRAAERWTRTKKENRESESSSGSKSSTRSEGHPLSPNTVNKNLRHLRSILRVAHRWGYLPLIPEFKLLKTPERDPRAETKTHCSWSFAQSAMLGLVGSVPVPGVLSWPALERNPWSTMGRPEIG